MWSCSAVSVKLPLFSFTFPISPFSFPHPMHPGYFPVFFLSLLILVSFLGLRETPSPTSQPPIIL